MTRRTWTARLVEHELPTVRVVLRCGRPAACDLETLGGGYLRCFAQDSGLHVGTFGAHEVARSLNGDEALWA